jgi:hypothetical protein
MNMEMMVGLALLFVALLLGWLTFRRLRLIRAGGADVSLRRVRASRPHSTRGWNLGVLRYQGDEIAWFRVISLSRGAEVRLNRRELEMIDRRPPGTSEEYVLPTDATVLRCRDGQRVVELAMTPDVLTGFLSWLESTPPGGLNHRQAS